jgi:predicted metal-dependent HD superfamily phosphohydrolase
MSIGIDEMCHAEQLRTFHLLQVLGREGTVAFYQHIAKTYAQEASHYDARANKDMEAVMAMASLVAGDQAQQLALQCAAQATPPAA